MNIISLMMFAEKIYQIICAEYSGFPVRYDYYDEIELLVGRDNLRRGDALTQELLAHWESVLSARKVGKQTAGADTSEEDKILQKIGEWKHDRT